MTEPFADEHAPEVAASEGAEPGAAGLRATRRSSTAFRCSPRSGRSNASGPASLPAVQAAAAAATGFVAGAATIALIKRRSSRKLARNGKNGSRRVADLLPITASRSFLVDVHVIGKQGD